jgi:tetratricopeptide (TPR) repeat protein
MYAVSFNREKSEERDIDKALEYYKKVLENEPNRIDRPTIMARLAFIGSDNPKSKMGRIKDRVEFYKWLDSFDDNKIKKMCLPLRPKTYTPTEPKPILNKDGEVVGHMITGLPPRDPNVPTKTQIIGIKNRIESHKEVAIANAIGDALAMEVPEEGLFNIMDQLPPDAPERKRVDKAIKRREKTKDSHERIVSTTDDKTLEKELDELKKLHLGEKTPFGQAENMCNELLEKYTEPEEQARIYYQLAVVYSQSGQIKPDKTIEFSKKALEFPVGPIERLKLYVWWGDAIMIAHRGARNQERVVARRKAVMPYLNGLKECLSMQYPKYTQPEHLPEEQNVKADPHASFLRRRRDEQRKALYEWKKDKFERDVNRLKKALTSQISGTYSDFPWASDEIRDLATKILEDKTAVDDLMSAVDEAVQQRKQELGLESELIDKKD